MDDALFGMETELAFSAWKSENALGDEDRAELIRDYFRLANERLCSLPDSHAPGLYLENGSRLYLDAGLHPEFCTPECRSPEELVRWQLAGERILAELGEELEKLQAHTRIALFRCNVDYSGSGETWGCHESYQYRCDSERMSTHLIPHLATRIVYTGAGGLNNRRDRFEFLLSPRVPHLLHDEASGSQSARGLYHTKNEALSSGHFNRLHLLCGESNSSQLSTYLKFGTTALIVRLIDAGVCRGNLLRFRSPRSAMYSYALDPECRAQGRLLDGRRLTAARVQREYLAMVEQHLDANFMPDWAPRVCQRWGQVLDQLESDPSSLSSCLDWAIKHALFRDHVSRSGTSWDQLRVGQGLAAELCEIDTRFGELGSKGVFHALDRADILDHRLPELGAVEQAMTSPPPGGRAEIRGSAIRELHPNRSRYYCSWEAIHDFEQNRVYDMSNPFGRSAEWRKGERRAFQSSPHELRQQRFSRHFRRARRHYNMMELSQAGELFEIVANRARAAEDYEIEALARFWSATVQLDLGNLDAAENTLTPILETIDQNGSDDTICRVWTRYALILIDRPAELPRIQEVAARVRAHIACRDDVPRGRSRASMIEARIQGLLGDYDRAIETAERALGEQEDDLISFSRSTYYRWLVSYLLRVDQLERADAHVKQWRKDLQTVDSALHEVVSLECAESTIARLRGQHARSLEHAQSAAARVGNREPSRSRLTAFCVLIESAAEAGEIEMARRHLEKLDQWGPIEIEDNRLDIDHARAALHRADLQISVGSRQHAASHRD